jgi:transglutaminase-like putative cysteine protease
MTAVAGDALKRLRDRLSVLQIAIAVGTVAAAGGVRWVSLVIAALLVAWSWVRPLPELPSRNSERAWTAGVALALVATLVRAYTSGDVLDAGIDFLLLLVVQRMFQRQRTREHMQLLLLGSLMMVTGAVINAGLDYPIAFAAYLVVATMALLVNHLVSEGERLGARTAALVAREGMRARNVLWRAAVQVALVAAIGAVITFVAFPRWGIGVFLRGGMAREAQSGFSSQVELGGFGRIKTDATVVMRLEPFGEADGWGERPIWHLRGSSFDGYRAGRWFHGDDVEQTPQVHWKGQKPAPIPGFADSEQMLAATVILEDLGVDVLFAASTPLGVRLSPRGPIEGRARVRAGVSGELRVDKAPGPIRYDFASRIGMPSADELRAVGDPTPGVELAPYLVRAELSPEVGELARRLTADADDRYEKVAAVLDHLDDFEYSLDNPESARVAAGADPVEGFLFDTQAGHCEYFATALALLLREADVPTRIVNGYYGAHYNSMGEYYAVRQADAHSWVEVHFGPLGWVTVDPTPPAGLVAGDGAPLWPAASQLVDAVRNAYLEWVIDYDLGKQLKLAEGLGLRDREATTGIARWRPLLLGLLGVSAALAIALRLRRWQRRRRSALEAIGNGLLAFLARRGHAPRPSESVPRFCARVGAARPAAASALAEFARRGEVARFGPEASAALVESVRAAAQGVKDSWKGDASAIVPPP